MSEVIQPKLRKIADTTSSENSVNRLEEELKKEHHRGEQLADSFNILLSIYKEQKKFNNSDADLVSSVKKRYNIRNEFGVINFLKEHDNLLRILPELNQKLEARFPEADYHLELENNSRLDINNNELVVVLQFSQPYENVLDRLDEFRENWWYEASESFSEKIFLHPEFV